MQGTRIPVILNPASGAASPGREEEIRGAFAAHGVSADLRSSVREGDVEALVRACVDDGCPVVVVGGGDGTLHAAAGVLAGTGCALGILPFGTLNHFAMDLSVPPGVKDAVAVIVAGVVRAVDVGEANGRVFLNNASLGLYPSTVRRRDAIRQRLGRGRWSAYPIAIWRSLLHYRLLDVRVRLESRDYLRRTPFVFVGNNRYAMDGLEIVDTLPRPQVVVPGNHDIPLVNLWRRFVRPLEGFRDGIGPDEEPFFVDSEIAVMGFNTARSLTWKGGRLSGEQIARARERLAPLPSSLVKLVVLHHPVEVPPGRGERDLVGRARLAMDAFMAAGADIFLSGHLHASHTARTADRYPVHGRCALVIHAGTASSTRRRGEVNSFNVLSVEAARLTVVTFDWDSAREDFIPRPGERYAKGALGWELA